MEERSLHNHTRSSPRSYTQQPLKASGTHIVAHSVYHRLQYAQTSPTNPKQHATWYGFELASAITSSRASKYPNHIEQALNSNINYQTRAQLIIHWVTWVWNSWTGFLIGMLFIYRLWVGLSLLFVCFFNKIFFTDQKTKKRKRKIKYENFPNHEFQCWAPILKVKNHYNLLKSKPNWVRLVPIDFSIKKRDQFISNVRRKKHKTNLEWVYYSDMGKIPENP